MGWETPTTVLLDLGAMQDDGLEQVVALARCELSTMHCAEVDAPAQPVAWPVVGVW